jgi:hypothetical protein
VLTEEKRRGLYRWDAVEFWTGCFGFSVLGFGLSAIMRDPSAAAFALGVAVLGQFGLGWMILTKADRERFEGGDLWIAAAWLSFAAACWLPIPYFWTATTGSPGVWVFTPFLQTLGAVFLWLAWKRQQLGPAAADRLLAAAAAVCGATTLLAAWVTISWLFVFNLSGLGAMLLGIALAPFAAWLSYRFHRRFRLGRQTR